MKLQSVIEALAVDLGHRLDEEVVGRYHRALTLLAQRSGESLHDLVGTLTPGSASWKLALESVLVHETYFFRDPAQFGLVAHLAESARQQGRPWASGLSVACSSGEEAYSLAATLLESNAPVSVVGLDVSGAALAIARTGLYDARSFREVPADVLGQRVEPAGGGSVQAGPQLKASVEFELLNLASPLHLDQLRRRRADVVFCRNVLMYLTPEPAEQLKSALFEAVSPHGCLVVGPLDVEGPPKGFVEARRPAGSAAVTELERRLASFGTASSVFIRASHARRAVAMVAPAVPTLPAPPQVRRLLTDARALADKGARREATRLLEGHDETPEVLLLLGTMLLEQGSFARAELCFRRVLLQQPGSIDASFRLLMVLSNTSDRKAQRQLGAVLEKAIAGRPDDLEVAPGITPSMIRMVLSKVP